MQELRKELDLQLRFFCVVLNVLHIVLMNALHLCMEVRSELGQAVEHDK